ncbi:MULTISPECIES: hypothetical protein [Flagellimonas]|uniref:Uncharacterized protein n=1 Tax=Flagellimonas olearia TaxID=552546 RepID=A0A444VI20_9FLAO|nr:hypothetical protein [Allomuricauda olearia]RYC50409.1 hypothetical protein DN53_05675 [Allomuricauda olearia]
MEDRVMVDVSMLLHRDSLNQMIGLAQAGALGQIVVSDTFVRMFGEAFNNNSEFGEIALSSLSFHFEIDENLIDINGIRTFLFSKEYSENIVRYSSENFNENEIFTNLLNQTEDDWIAEILFEEWEFLTTNSWLVCKFRAALDKIVEAGGTAIHVSKRAFETFVRKTIKKPQGDLSPNDNIRAFGKWIAVGGSVLAGFTMPVTSAILTGASGVFLIYDP